MKKNDFLSKNSNMRILDAREQKMIVGGTVPTKNICSDLPESKCDHQPCINSDGNTGYCVFGLDVLQNRMRCMCAAGYMG